MGVDGMLAFVSPLLRLIMINRDLFQEIVGIPAPDLYAIWQVLPRGASPAPKTRGMTEIKKVIRMEA